MDKSAEEIADELLAAAGIKPGQKTEQKDGKSKEKAADVLIRLATGAEELFHAPDGTGFATIPVGVHLETWPVRSRGFRRWLARAFFRETSTACNSDAIQAALNVIEAKAHFDGKERPVYVRVGAYEGRLYLDLADVRWRAIEIDADGWRIVDRPPIPFRRAAGMQALPEPVSGGSINDLRPFLNIADDKDFALAVSFILAALRDRGPYPVLVLLGEHGSAKSTLMRVARKLVDPNSAPLRSLPREDRDLFIAANNANLLAFDNVSKLPDWISDTLCRLATGGGFATRQLYTDLDEQLFDAMRAVVVNAIEDVVIRPDLADRSVFLTLLEIPEDKRRDEAGFWRDFERVHARILGALLDGVAHGLRRLPDTRLDKSPRMADFALWATACETAYWEPGTFARAYGLNRDEAASTVIEADLVATAVQSFMAARTVWSGTSSDLLGALKMAVGEDQAKLKEWPPTPRALSARLRRAAATLRKVGVDIAFERVGHGKRARTITITCLPVKEGNFASPPSPPSPAKDFNGLCGDAKSDIPPFASPGNFASPANSLKNKAGDANADGDAKFRTQTGKGGTGPPPEPITSWEMDELRGRGFSPDDLFNMNPTRARAILADPERNKLTERYGKGGDAPPDTVCRVCKKPGAKLFSEPLGPGERPDRFPGMTPLHLECAPKFFESGGLSLEPDDRDEHGSPVAATNGGEPGISRRRIEELKRWIEDRAEAQRRQTGEVDQGELEEALRIVLREEVLPEHVEVECQRVWSAVFDA